MNNDKKEGKRDSWELPPWDEIKPLSWDLPKWTKLPLWDELSPFKSNVLNKPTEIINTVI